MTFSGERYGAKNLKDGVDSHKKIEELETVNAMQDNVIGLHEWDQKVQREEIGRLKQQVEDLGIDGLTGIQRREIFKNGLNRVFSVVRNEEKELREGAETPSRISLIFLDLDRFKQVNDTYGHAMGDEVLKRVAGLLKVSLRETDILTRYGGDEFAVLLVNTDERNAVLLAEKLRASIDEDSTLKSFGVTASIGVCSSEVSTADNSETFIEHADGAAYVAKRGGGNRVEVYK